MSDENLLAARRSAIAYAQEHLQECASEIVEWRSTGVLRDGRLRELGQITALLNRSDALQIAESFVVRAALEAAALPAIIVPVEG